MEELEAIMIEHSVVLRAMPKKVRSIYETQHKEKYPSGTIKYLDAYKRDMLIVETTPEHAGKFIFECQTNTSTVVRFAGRAYFDSIEEAVDDLLKRNPKE